MTIKKAPVPREPKQWQCRSSHNGETWLEGEVDGTRRAYVRFPDGQLRVVKADGVSDTFFSIPVKDHDGYITTRRTIGGGDEYVFMPHDKSKDKYGEWPCDACLGLGHDDVGARCGSCNYGSEQTG